MARSEQLWSDSQSFARADKRASPVCREAHDPLAGLREPRREAGRFVVSEVCKGRGSL